MGWTSGQTQAGAGGSQRPSASSGTRPASLLLNIYHRGERTPVAVLGSSGSGTFLNIRLQEAQPPMSSVSVQPPVSSPPCKSACSSTMFSVAAAVAVTARSTTAESGLSLWPAVEPRGATLAASSLLEIPPVVTLYLYVRHVLFRLYKIVDTFL
jgi:hypothetical protein